VRSTAAIRRPARARWLPGLALLALTAGALAEQSCPLAEIVPASLWQLSESSACLEQHQPGLTVEQSPGTRARVDLLLSSHHAEELIYHIDLRTTDSGAIDWLASEPSAGRLAPGRSETLALSIDAHTSLPPLSSHSVMLLITLHDEQSEYRIELPVHVLIGAEPSLFRDEFEVDPVLGQFSQRPDSQPARPYDDRPIVTFLGPAQTGH